MCLVFVLLVCYDTALRILVEKETESLTGNTQGSHHKEGPAAHESSKHLLQWLDIFSKLSQVITSSLRDRSSPSNQAFGHALTALALKTSSNLLVILDEDTKDLEEDNDPEDSYHLNEDFSKQLQKHVTVIREASFGGYTHRQHRQSLSVIQRKKPVFVDPKVEVSSNRSWGRTTTVEVQIEKIKDEVPSEDDPNSRGSFMRKYSSPQVLSELLNSCLLKDSGGRRGKLLKQQLLWRRTGVNVSWNNIVSFLVDSSLERIKDGMSSEAETILSLVNISLNDMMPAVAQQSFHSLTSPSASACLSSKIALLMHTYSELKTFTVSQECLDILQDELKKYLLPRFLDGEEDSENLDCDDMTIISTLISFNQSARLVSWLRNLDQISPALLKLDVEGHALTREKMSSELLMKAWSLNPDLLPEMMNYIQDLVKGFYRNGMSIFSESASKFLPKVCDYFVQNELHELRLWLSSRITGFEDQDLMSGTESSLSFALIQKCAEIITHIKGNDVWHDKDVLKVSTLMSGLFCFPAVDSALLSRQVDQIQLSFPFISKSLPSFGIPIKDNDESSSSLYYVLRRSTSLEMSKCFRWQENNLFRESHQELPSFARHFIPGFKGLDTSIDTLYFIREGRPCHAFVKGSGFCQDRVADALNLANSVGSKRTEVLSSEVLFQEIVLKNSWNLRLHLTAANFIGKYAADFLGLKFRQQENALGTLLKACLKKSPSMDGNDDTSVIKMLSLLVAAFERKYHEKRKMSVEECLEWELVHHFCQEHALEPACELMVKCAQNDDWLLFVVSAQIYDIPKQIILDLLSSFNNRCIADHLEKAFRSSYTTNEGDENPIAILKAKEKKSQFSSRQGLYNKIGVVVVEKEARKRSSFSPPTSPLTSIDSLGHPFEDQKSMTSDADDRQTSMTDTISVLSNGSAGNSNTCRESIASLPPPIDLYNLIMEAQKRTQQSFEETILAYGIHLKNPILVLFSASLNPAMLSSSFDILCFWLASAFKPPGFSLPNNETTWSTKHMCSLLSTGMRSLPNLRTLRMGLQLFDYERNPFFLLVQFFIEFTLDKKLMKSVDSLKSFQESYWKFTSDVPSNPLENLNDLSPICATLIESCVISLDDFHETRLLLRHLDFARVHSMFTPNTKIANFNCLSRMCQTVQETDFEIPAGSLISLSDTSDEYKQILENLVRSLQTEGYFVEASQLAALASLNMDEIIINEWRIKSKSNINNLSFWKNLFLQITKAVNDRIALFHFLTEVDQEPNCSIVVRLFVLCYAYRFLSEVDEETAWKVERLVYENLLQLETTCSSSYIEEFNEVWSIFGQSMKSLQPLSHEIPIRDVPISEHNKNSLDKVIGRIPSLDTAIRFSRFFGYHSKDADILHVCHRLVTNGSLNSEDCRHCIDCLSLQSTQKISSQQTLEATDVLVIMDGLTQKASYATSICQRTALQFKISLALGKSVQEINGGTDQMTVIRNLISAAGVASSSSSGQLFTPVDLVNLAKEFISCYKIEDTAVAKLVLHEVISGMNRDSKDNVSVESSASGTEGGSGAGFLSLLRLLNDSSVLGKHILLHLKGGFLDDQPLSHAVELYIRAHDCFSVCSDIEGISLVLRNARQLVVQQLAPANDYYSMIRLLTGIGRYSEMTYIFDLLKEHHKFEMLLGKRIEKVPQLRIALLDSLKGDKEMYPLVALNFSMHREIAEMMEEDSLKNMKNLSLRRSLTAGNVKDVLERSMADLVDAAESYSKASCYNQSRKCALWAELVALQISLLPKSIDVLSMSPQTVADFIIMHPNCAEAMILADAYAHQRSWPAALFTNVVKRGDWSYFREYVALKGPVSSALLQEICVITIHDLPSIAGSAVETNLLKLINTCKGDMEGLQILLSKLRQSNMRDLINKINIPTEGDDTVYIQDLMRNSSSNF